MYVDLGATGAGRQQVLQLGLGSQGVVPLQRVNDLVVLLHAAQLLQLGGRVHVHRPGETAQGVMGMVVQNTRVLGCSVMGEATDPSSLPMATTVPSGFQLKSV